jgi:EAL domain-containing protein (putative c-di-GMP-specific phosphodiesterase class I)/FixJ family two-component response regulator
MPFSRSAPVTADAPARYAYVLDDDLRVGALVCRMIKAAGYQARQFETPIPFLAEVKGRSPEIVVLDLTLQQSDAVDVIRGLAILHYAGKILLISGHNEDTLAGVQAVGKSHGMAMLPPLRKPFKGDDLKRSLDAPAETSTRKLVVPESPVLRVDLAEALERRWLELWYQPKIDLATLSLCGAEALLRARHPEGAIVGPRELLPPSGDPLYRPLTLFVLRQAMADWEFFADRGTALHLSVNIPISVLNAPEFVGWIRDLVPRDPRFPGLLVEVLEDEVIRDVDQIREVAAQLRLYKTEISIDDFGTAYSSLSRLRDLPCAEVKIDRSFVFGSATDAAKKAICQTVVNLAHRFGAKVCAEGIETAEDLATLLTLGCDNAQGFLFAKPMATDAFLSFVGSQQRSG